jgi:hypothetical protein
LFGSFLPVGSASVTPEASDRNNTEILARVRDYTRTDELFGCFRFSSVTEDVNLPQLCENAGPGKKTLAFAPEPTRAFPSPHCQASDIPVSHSLALAYSSTKTAISKSYSAITGTLVPN